MRRSSSATRLAGWDYLELYDGAGAATLTLGPSLLVQQVGYYAQIDDTNSIAGSEIVNEGTIDAGTAGLTGTQFNIYGPAFDNQGVINVGRGVHLV